jgi:hypothetical protein
MPPEMLPFYPAINMILVPVVLNHYQGLSFGIQLDAFPGSEGA